MCRLVQFPWEKMQKSVKKPILSKTKDFYPVLGLGYTICFNQIKTDMMLLSLV